MWHAGNRMWNAEGPGGTSTPGPDVLGPCLSSQGSFYYHTSGLFAMLTKVYYLCD